MSGIRTLEDLRERSFVDDATGCWHWRGALSSRTRPSMWIPDLERVGTVGTLLTHLTGKSGGFWIPTCRCSDCVSPQHRVYGTAGELQRVTRPKLTPLHRARIAAARRKTSRVTTEESARQIRESAETLAVVAERHGMSVAMASKIRRHLAWAPVSPWEVAA